MDLFTTVLLNIAAIPFVALIDYIVLKPTIRRELGREPELWHFLPACFLELMFFNFGIVFGTML